MLCQFQCMFVPSLGFQIILLVCWWVHQYPYIHYVVFFFTLHFIVVLSPFKSVGVWDGVEEKFHKRLAMWKRLYLQRWEAYPDSKHFIQYAYIFYVFVLYSKGNQVEVGANSKGFLMRRGFLSGIIIQYGGLLFVQIKVRAAQELGISWHLTSLSL